MKLNNQSNTVNKSSENKTNYIQLYQNNLSKIKNIIIEKSSLLDNIFNEKYLQNIHKIRNTLFIGEIFPYYSYDQIIKNKFNNEKISLKRNPHYVSIKHCELQKKLFQNIEEIRNKTNKLLNIRKLQQYDILEVKRKYKALKKSLFSWNNSWSEWEVFYKANYSKTLKFKVSNYYSSNLMKPFLVPILNIDYYLPGFSKYNAKNLFQNENDAVNENKKIERNTNNIYKVEFDYDKIFFPEKDDNINDSKQKYTNFVKYLYCNVYENQYLNNNCTITQNSVLGTHPKKCKKQVLCCIIKQTHHIMSVLKVKQHDLKISRNSEINKAISIYKANNLWDNEKNSCFGNVFPSYPRISYVNKIIIPIKSIHMIFKRSYFFIYNSLEFFTTNHKSFFIHFVNETSCMETLLSIIHNQCKVDFREIQINKRIKGNQDYIIGYIQNTGDYKTKCLYSNLNTLTDNWRNWKLSNFDYLMYLNLFGDGSCDDLNQYPVMPWVLKDYTHEQFNLNEFNESSLRDLSLPMGMIEINEMNTTRKKNFIDNYKSMLLEIKTGLGFYDDENSEEANVNEAQDIENEEKINEKVWNDYIDKDGIDLELIPYFYGTHYSNPMYVNHYLLRLFPYSVIIIEMQGNQFDDPQRLFFSLNNTFHSATTQKCDVRELIPEFFYLPEMFLNINQLNMGNVSILNETTGDTTSFKINNVNLPPWCNNNPYLFVSIMIEILNSYKINNLNKWIDLIFGTLQKGKKARKAKNIFSPYSYLNFVNFEGLSESKIITYKKFFELGITPNQVYSREVNNKIIPKQFKGNILSCCKFLRYFSKLLNNEYLPCYYSFIENKKLLIMFTNYSYGIIDFNSMLFTKVGLEELSFLNEIIPQTILSKITHLHTYIKTNIHSYHYHTYLTYNKGKNIVIGGFFEGNLLLYSKANQSIIQIIWPIQIIILQ